MGGERRSRREGGGGIERIGSWVSATRAQATIHTHTQAHTNIETHAHQHAPDGTRIQTHPLANESAPVGTRNRTVWHTKPHLLAVHACSAASRSDDMVTYPCARRTWSRTSLHGAAVVTFMRERDPVHCIRVQGHIPVYTVHVVTYPLRTWPPCRPIVITYPHHRGHVPSSLWSRTLIIVVTYLLRHVVGG